MKEDSIRIRIDSKLKEDFMCVCEFENITLSNKIHQFIVDEVRTKLPQNPEQQILDLLPHDDIIIVKQPIFVIDGDGDVVDNDSGGHVVHVQTFVGNINEYLETHKDKRIYLFLAACDFNNNQYRLTAIKKDGQ